MNKRNPRKKERAGKAGRRATSEQATCVLRLYVTGSTPRAKSAVMKVKSFCEEHLKGHYRLDVIDIYQQPDYAREEQIIAAPTLVKKLPRPLRRLVGDFSSPERVMVGLSLPL